MGGRTCGSPGEVISGSDTWYEVVRNAPWFVERNGGDMTVINHVATSAPALRRLAGGVAVAALFVVMKLDLIASMCCALCANGQVRCCDTAGSECSCAAQDGQGCSFFCPGFTYDANCS
jgi:hypothetical protein